MDYRNLIQVEGTIVEVTGMRDNCCDRQVSFETASGVIHMIITGDTYVIDNTRLRPGMRVVAYYDGSLPVPLIYPPRYQTALITAVRPGQHVALNFFDDRLLAEDGSLKINPGGRGRITTLNGQPFTCSLANHVLLVYYTVTTRSIPPQTTPERILVLCQ